MGPAGQKFKPGLRRGRSVSPLTFHEIGWLDWIAETWPKILTRWHEPSLIYWQRVRLVWLMLACTVYPLTWNWTSDHLALLVFSRFFNPMCYIVIIADAIYIFQNEKGDFSHMLQIGCAIGVPLDFIYYTNFLRLTVLLKVFLLRMHYTSAFYQWANSLFTSNRDLVRLLRLLTELSIFLHLYTCFFYDGMIDEYEHLTSKPFSDAHDDFTDKYVAALYWAVSKFCGSDWLSEIESTRKMHIISYMIIAYFIEGSLLGNLVALGSEDANNARYERVTERTNTIQCTGEALGFAQRLIDRLAKYEIQLDVETGGSSLSDILDSLSMDVRREVFKFLIDNTFSKVSLFDGAPSLFKTKTISEMRIVPFQAGSMLVEQGWPMDEFAVIISGELEVFVGNTKIDKVLSAGDSLGEVTLIKSDVDAVASASLVSKTSGLLYTVQREKMLEILNLFPAQKQAIHERATLLKRSDTQRRWKILAESLNPKSPGTPSEKPVKLRSIIKQVTAKARREARDAVSGLPALEGVVRKDSSRASGSPHAVQFTFSAHSKEGVADRMNGIYSPREGADSSTADKGAAAESSTNSSKHTTTHPSSSFSSSSPAAPSSSSSAAGVTKILNRRPVVDSSLRRRATASAAAASCAAFSSRHASAAAGGSGLRDPLPSLAIGS